MRPEFRNLRKTSCELCVLFIVISSFIGTTVVVCHGGSSFFYCSRQTLWSLHRCLTQVNPKLPSGLKQSKLTARWSKTIEIDCQMVWNNQSWLPGGLKQSRLTSMWSETVKVDCHVVCNVKVDFEVVWNSQSWLPCGLKQSKLTATWSETVKQSGFFWCCGSNNVFYSAIALI